jgi:hypothetical protein
VDEAQVDGTVRLDIERTALRIAVTEDLCGSVRPKVSASPRNVKLIERGDAISQTCANGALCRELKALERHGKRGQFCSARHLLRFCGRPVDGYRAIDLGARLDRIRGKKVDEVRHVDAGKRHLRLCRVITLQ